MVPALFGVSVAQISLLIDNLFASFLPGGSITWLYYSDRLTYFPLGIFGVAIATVILPHLSQKHADRSIQEFSVALDWALRCILIIAIPSAVGLFVLAKPLFAALFQYGKFTVNDVIMASHSLSAYAFGLPAFMLVKVLASGFYSKQDIRTPVKIAVVAVIANIIFNFILIFPLKHAGLALSTSISSSLNAALLFIFLVRRGAFQVQKGWLIYFLRVGAAGLVMGLLLYWIAPELADWENWQWFQRGWHLLLLISVAIVSYLASLRLMGVKLRDFRGTPRVSY